MGGDRLPHDGVVAVEDRADGVAQGVEEPRRPFDVAEHECHGAGRQRRHEQASWTPAIIQAGRSPMRAPHRVRVQVPPPLRKALVSNRLDLLGADLGVIEGRNPWGFTL